MPDQRAQRGDRRIRAVDAREREAVLRVGDGDRTCLETRLDRGRSERLARVDEQRRAPGNVW